MIRINLLPYEFRRGQRISLKVLAASVGAALLVCASIGWFGLVYFGELGELEAEHQAVAAELETKSRQAAYFDRLDANRKDYISRVQTIQEIGKSRRLWSKFLDELIDVVNNDGDTERHLAWFSSMSVSGDPKRGVNVSLPGAIQGGEVARLANLHEDFEASPFWRDIQSMSDPGGRLEVDKSREPPEAWGFTLQLQFKPPAGDGKDKK